MCRTATSKTEAGFTLAGVLSILGVIMVFVTMTVPRQWSMVMARERDKQTIFIMKQYARSIRNFQMKHGSAPVSLQQLKDARSPRMMRGTDGEWIDPLTGEVDWIPIPASALAGQSPAEPSRNPAAFRPIQPIPPSGPGQTGRTGQPAQPGQPGQAGQAGQPGGMIGPIVGVRPNKTGKSFLSLNGAENYEEWIYTIQELEQEITGRRAALATK